MKQEFILDVIEGTGDELVAEVQKRVGEGVGFVVTDASAPTLLKMADAIQDKDAIIFNTSAPDEELREDNAASTSSTRCLRAACLQMRSANTWPGSNGVSGSWSSGRPPRIKPMPMPSDARPSASGIRSSRSASSTTILAAVALMAATSKFSSRSRASCRASGARRGRGRRRRRAVRRLFPYRTWTARPVIGTSGLFATSWHPAIELWGGTQFQNRFRKLADRTMRPLDYTVWMAVRSVGEAATRKKTADPKNSSPACARPSSSWPPSKDEAHLSLLERPVAPAHHRRHCQAAGIDLTASGLPASVDRARHARRRQARDEVQGIREMSQHLPNAGPTRSRRTHVRLTPFALAPICAAIGLLAAASSRRRLHGFRLQ